MYPDVDGGPRSRPPMGYRKVEPRDIKLDVPEPEIEKEAA